jgi:hypothetical protein
MLLCIKGELCRRTRRYIPGYASLHKGRVLPEDTALHAKVLCIEVKFSAFNTKLLRGMGMQRYGSLILDLHT